jgi:hypothetical protein
MAFCGFGQATECILFLDFLKPFLLVNMDGSFPVSRSMQHLDSQFMS